MENKDKLRMYGFVPYNLSPIQQGIQFGHAVVEYQLEYDRIEKNMKLYNDWAMNYKTFIILNGGTSNNATHYTDPIPNKDKLIYEPLPLEELAGLQYCEAMLSELGIDYATFQEPDLNNMTTAVVFILDEMVYNKEKFPSYKDWWDNMDESERKYLPDNVEYGKRASKEIKPELDRYYKEVFGDETVGEYKTAVREFISKYRFA